MLVFQGESKIIIARRKESMSLAITEIVVSLLIRVGLPKNGEFCVSDFFGARLAFKYRVGRIYPRAEKPN